jgi:hypothetical protein
MMRTLFRTTMLLGAGSLLLGCEGYNVQFGTTASNLAGFHQIYEMPATSLRPWSERSTPLSVPPPDDGSSGVSTLPAARGALPPESPAGPASAAPAR